MLKNRFGSARANSLQNTPVFQLLLAGAFALGCGAAGHYLHNEISVPAESVAYGDAAPAPQTAAAQTFAEVRSAIAGVVKPLAPKPEAVTREVEIESGDTFADMLGEAGIADQDALAAMGALGKVYDLRKLKAGQDVTLSLLRTGNQESLSSISFQPEAAKEVVIARTADGGFRATMALVPVTHRNFAGRAEIRSSLFEAGEEAHIPHPIMASLMRIYSHEVDFQRDIHPGDRFEVLYDQPVNAKGVAVGEGTISYAALVIGGRAKPVYRVSFADGTSEYFDEQGKSTRRAFMRTPVAAAHITSGFGMRMHPILGYSKMHQGVDFGAPAGTPIFAAAAGTVVEIGPKGGYGRYIRLHHSGAIETVYAHMSRFSSSLYRGAHVEQGQVIGYVGASGRATGPHLHYEIHVAGKPINPLSVPNMPAGRVLSGKLLAEFKQTQLRIRQEFAGLSTGNATLIKASAVAPAFTVAEARGL